MKIADMVENVLRDVPITRDSDPVLVGTVYWQYYQEYIESDGDEWWINGKAFIQRKLPNPDTITRARRKLQEDGSYPSTVREGREQNKEDMRMDMPTSFWRERLEELR